MLALRLLAALALAAASVVAGAEDAQGPAASRLVIEQAIGMWRIHGGLRGVGRTPDAMAFSPDGRSFTLILVQGNLATERNDFRLELCTILGDPAHRDRIELRREPLVTFSTTGSTAAISTVRWIDGETIAFLGSEDGKDTQVYELDLRTRGVRRRTDASAPVVAYGLSRGGGTVLYATMTRADPGASERSRLIGLIPEPDENAYTFGGTKEFGSDIDVYVRRDARSPATKVTTIHGSTLTAEGAFSWGSGIMAVSPDEQHAVIAPYFGKAVPDDWRGIKARAVSTWIENRRGASGIPPSFALVDLRTNEVKPLDIPATGIDQLYAAWAPDGKRLFVSGFLPMRAEFPRATEVDRADGGILAVDPANGEYRLVEAGKWRMGDMSRDGRTLRLSTGLPDTGGADAERSIDILDMEDGAQGWRAREKRAVMLTSINPWSQVAVGRDFVVGHVESADQPPELALVSIPHGWTRIMTRLNPQLDAVRRGKVLDTRPLAMKDSVWPVQVVLPVGYQAGTRYPTVIMVMDMSYNPGYVLDSHIYRAAFPIQALASRGFAVMMAYFPKDYIAKTYNRPAEREMARQFADAAVDDLVASEIADPKRIAITGFSRSGFLAEYGVQHSKHRFAAVVGIDNFTGSYLQYILNNAPPSFEQFYGGALPFTGHGQEEWWKEAIGFNGHRLRAPLLKESHGRDWPGIQVAAWETYAALRRFDIPVELVHYRSAIHIMRRVPEQLSSAERQVDWLCFWVKGEEDPAPEKAEQYRRWREMRAKWEKTKAAR